MHIDRILLGFGIMLSALSFVLIFLYVIIRHLTDKYGKVKTVEAVVIHKSKMEPFSKVKSSGMGTRCYVVFQVNGKKISFRVSEFSYNGYRIGEKGTLKYKGERLIDFK